MVNIYIYYMEKWYKPARVLGIFECIKQKGNVPFCVPLTEPIEMEVLPVLALDALNVKCDVFRTRVLHREGFCIMCHSSLIK